MNKAVNANRNRRTATATIPPWRISFFVGLRFGSGVNLCLWLPGVQKMKGCSEVRFLQVVEFTKITVFNFCFGWIWKQDKVTQSATPMNLNHSIFGDWYGTEPHPSSFRPFYKGLLVGQSKEEMAAVMPCRDGTEQGPKGESADQNRDDIGKLTVRDIARWLPPKRQFGGQVRDVEARN